MVDADATASSSSEAIIDINDIPTAAAESECFGFRFGFQWHFVGTSVRYQPTMGTGKYVELYQK